MSLNSTLVVVMCHQEPWAHNQIQKPNPTNCWLRPKIHTQQKSNGFWGDYRELEQDGETHTSHFRPIQQFLLDKFPGG